MPARSSRARVARPLPSGARADRRHRAARSRRHHCPFCVEATAKGEDVARLHSGDLSIFSAVGRAVAAPGAGRGGVHGHARRARFSPPPPPRSSAKLTLPGSRAIPGADPHLGPAPRRCRRRETLANFAATGANALRSISRFMRLRMWSPNSCRFMGPDCPAGDCRPRLMAGRADRGARHSAKSWGALREAPIERTAIILVGPRAWV